MLLLCHLGLTPNDTLLMIMFQKFVKDYTLMTVIHLIIAESTTNLS